jgi:hypothetical protein
MSRQQALLVTVCLVALAGCGEAITYQVGPAAWSNLPSTPPPGATDATGTSQPTRAAASVLARIQREYQGDPTIGWDSHAQYEAEWRSACGPTAMTVVLKAWGVQTRVGLVLDLLWKAGAYHNGMHDLATFANIVPQYYGGLDSTYFFHLTDQHLEAMTDAGYPVLVNIWDEYGRYYPFQPGHWLVVIGHDAARGIQVVDSSSLNLHWIPWQAWDVIFTHRSILIHQKGAQLP